VFVSSDSVIPGQFGLLTRLAVDMFEEVGIDLVGDAAIGLRRRPHGPGWAGNSGRAAWWRILPEAAVFEDFADDVALMGLDERILPYCWPVSVSCDPGY